MRRIHLNDTPATTPEHRAHIKHIAEVYRPRTEARRKCQEMREALETDMLTEYASSILRRLHRVITDAAPRRLLIAEIAAAAGLDRREAARWLQEGDGTHWRSERERLVTPRYKAPRWHRVYFGDVDYPRSGDV